MKVLNITKQNSNPKFKANIRYSPSDYAYKKLIQEGLKDSFDLNCKIEDLASIATPNEIKSLIKNLKPQHYTPGENFRANFHMHTNASDGAMSLNNYLEQCVDWANYIFKKGFPKDNLPPFSAAITDHDTVLNSKKAIAAISQEPDKYKNLKFLSGCEFLFRDNVENPNKYFEAIGLGFNPFDKNLAELFKNFRSKNTIKDIPKIKKAGGILSFAHPYASPENCNDDFFKFLKQNGIQGAENNYQYQYLATIRLKKPEEYTKDDLKCLNYYKEIEASVRKFAKKHKMFETGGTDAHGSTIITGPFGGE